MPDESHPPEVKALLDELAVLRDEIALRKREQDVAYARRLTIFKRLTKLKIKQGVQAEAAGVTPMAVGFALSADRKKRDAKSAAKS